MSEQQLLESPLHEVHVELGASFTPFGEWNMPLKYASELAEHRAVREKAGLFDLSHMGEVRVSGAQAAEYLDYALISKLSAIAVGKAKYTMIVGEDGGIIDDLIVYRQGEDEYLVVPNAGNAVVVAEELLARGENFDVTVTDESRETALIAVQGPQAEEIMLSQVADDDDDAVRNLKYYAGIPLTVAGIACFVARTGYTGEDGFELFIPNAVAPQLWKSLSDAGADLGLLPCGLAARDSLRLEAGMPLYGNELSRNQTPIDAGLGVLIGKDKGDFVGKHALDTQRAEQSKTGPGRRLIGLVGGGRRAARAGAQIVDEGGTELGVVTSGQPSPTLGYPVALAYADPSITEPGTEVSIDIRGKRYPFTVVKLPFYKREK